MAKKQFKTESKRLLDLMIHSIYTHKEIFLRELISNASDAMDKLLFHSLGDGVSGISREDFKIELEIDAEKRQLTIRDNGIGMTKNELENNLGTIARSGSLDFKQDNQTGDNNEIDIIGQFGVGFYSAFMVSAHVTVVSRSYGSAEAWCWQSDGADGYTITACETLNEHGTTVVLTIKQDTEDEQSSSGQSYSEFLQPYRIRGIVKKYSDYIRYPIQMETEHSREKEHGSENDPEAEPEWETYTEIETLNSMVPIWRKNKNELTDGDYQQFYKDKFHDYENPLRVIHSSAEGAATYQALLFIPARTPYNYYTRDFEKGLQLYASGVLIMDKCADLLPDFFGFVRGLVDSQDLSLNISREMLQHDRQLRVIASRLEKKIKSELESMLENQREEYEKFFDQFGLPLKYGVYSNFGQHKELLADLLLFKYSGASADGSAVMTTLSEYVGRMKEDQKYIYYACGQSPEQIKRLPQTEAVLDKGYEILFMTDDVDEFALKMLHTHQEKEFRSVAAGDIGIDEDKDEEKKDADQNKDLYDFLTDILKDKVKAVRASKRLKTHPVCLTSEGEVSIEMEKVLGAMPDADKNRILAERVLEINENHAIFGRLTALLESDKDKLGRYAQLLYSQALLIEGLPVEDPVAFSNLLCELMA